MTKNLLVVVALVAGAAAGLGLALLERERGAQLEAGTVFATPRTLPPTALVDHSGKPLTADRLTGQWDILFFGFTHCPDICPTTLVQLDRLLERLDAGAQAPRVWLVSVDPLRDTPAVLADYIGHYNRGFAALTGTEAAIAGLAAALGVAYSKVVDGDGYTMAHSGALFLVDPAGRYAGLFTTPHDWQLIAADLRKLIL